MFKIRQNLQQTFIFLPINEMSQEHSTSRIELLLRFGLEDLADGAVGPAAAHDEEDDGEQCCKKEVS